MKALLHRERQQLEDDLRRKFRFAGVETRLVGDHLYVYITKFKGAGSTAPDGAKPEKMVEEFSRTHGLKVSSIAFCASI